jgi:ribosomal protein L11 methyltransferase
VIRLAVRVRRAQAELVLADLLELAPSGVEEAESGEDVVEYAVYGAPGELPSLPDLKAAAGRALVEISTTETADDWPERWRQFHRPVLIEPAPASRATREVPALLVRPPWQLTGPEPASAAVEEIVIDPGQAFGTGAHATTRLCLRMLLELAAAQVSPGALVDVGTGSGVLAIAGARLGFSPVLALDHERASLAAARSNAQANHAPVEVRELDLRREPLPLPAVAPATEIAVLANLLRPLLLDLADALSAPPAHLLASGLLGDQVDEVVRAFAVRLGMTEHARLEHGEWAAVWLTTPR